MRIWKIVAGLAVCLSACTATPTNVRPVITILTPIDGARVTMGQPVNVIVAAASSNNISRVEIRADGTLLGSLPNDPPTNSFSGRVSFAPDKQGIVQLTTVAIDSLGGSSDVLRVQLIVEPPPLPVNQDLPIQPTTVSQSASREPQPATGCTWNSAFVADVSIPDKTVIHGGEGFIKTWRLKNTSTCDWPDNFELYFVSGDKMSALASTRILPAHRGDSVDVSMGFLAPRSNGDYTSIWQLRAVGGQPFGTKFYVTIKVTDQ